MGRERQQIDAEFGHVEPKTAGCLNRIGMKEDPALARERGQFGNRVNGSKLVVGKHQRDEPGVRAQGCAEFVERNASVAVDRQQRDVPPFGTQHVERVQHGVMLGRGTDDVARIARARRTKNRQVIAFRTAACENDLARFCAEQSGVEAGLTEIRQHRGQHFVAHRRRGGVIEVDPARHAFRRAAIQSRKRASSP